MTTRSHLRLFCLASLMLAPACVVSSADDDTTSTDTGGCDTDCVACTVDEDCSALEGACASASCVAGACEVEYTADDTPCDSGNMCMSNEVCTDGLCGGGDAVDCSDLDGECVAGTCDPNTGACSAAPVNEGGSCNDGDPCSVHDMCSAGECMGSLTDYHYSEDFSSGAASGWTPEGKWAIGPAEASDPGQVTQQSDPAEDHTDTDDEMLAGIEIGGLSGPPADAEMQYLTSPVIDLSNIDEGVAVDMGFWRYLVDTVALAQDTVEVWDGADWVVVYDGTAVDLDWTEVRYDISSYRNADFQIRIGHQYTGPELGTAEPSWSVDDVFIDVCPSPGDGDGDGDGDGGEGETTGDGDGDGDQLCETNDECDSGFCYASVGSADTICQEACIAGPTDGVCDEDGDCCGDTATCSSGVCL